MKYLLSFNITVRSTGAASASTHHHTTGIHDISAVLSKTQEYTDNTPKPLSFAYHLSEIAVFHALEAVLDQESFLN